MRTVKAMATEGDEAERYRQHTVAARERGVADGVGIGRCES